MQLCLKCQTYKSSLLNLSVTVFVLFVGGGEGRTCFTEKVSATRKCEEVAATTWKLFPFFLWTRPNLWRFASAQVGSHL